MRAFEIAMSNEHFNEIVKALQGAAELVPDNLRQHPSYLHFQPTIVRLNLELSLDLLEEVSVDHEGEFPKAFWLLLLEASQFLQLHDNSNYYRRILRENFSGNV